MPITIDMMTGLARSLIDADEAVEMAELALNIAKEKARVLREETLPGAMQELGVESLTLTTGQKLKLVQVVYASIPATNKTAAYAWLNDNNFGGIIKTEVAVSFGKGEMSKAKDLLNELADMGFGAELSQSIHAQTLKAFLKEQLATGAKIPLDLFGARPVLAAKIT